MTKRETNSKVDAYLGQAKKWQKEMEQLRAIALSCPLVEELKWGKPCYTFEGTNIVLIVGFKEYCALLFTKGALLKDPEQILIQPTENMQAARQARFTALSQITKVKSTLKAYILEAIEVEKAGLKVVYKKVSEFKMVEEFQTELAKNAALKTAFEKLTPGRQKAYLLYFAGAKQSKTRTARVEKSIPRILAGQGMDD